MRKYLAGAIVAVALLAAYAVGAKSFTDASVGYVRTWTAGAVGETWDDPAPDGGIAVADGGTSTAVDVGGAASCVITGHASDTTTITLQVSPDSATWFDTGTTETTSGAADFEFTATVAARYARLKTSASVGAVSAWISCK